MNNAVGKCVYDTHAAPIVRKKQSKIFSATFFSGSRKESSQNARFLIVYVLKFHFYNYVIISILKDLLH